MSTVALQIGPKSSSVDEPIQHEDQVDNSVSVGERKAEVKYRRSSVSFHDQIKKTREVFEDLKMSVIASTKISENTLAQLEAIEIRHNKLSSRLSSTNFESAIKLNVGGTIYETSLESLTKYPVNLLTEMFSESFRLKQSSDGSYFIDRDGTHFRHILNYLRCGTIPVLSILKRDSEEILKEAEYYGLAGLVKAINNQLNGDNNSSEIVQEECESAVYDKVEEARKEVCKTGRKLNSFLSLLDANLKASDEAASHHKEISMKLSNVHFGENVKIDVGGRIFKTSLKTLRREPESILALMFSERFDLKKEDDGSFFIDRDGTLFHHILNYLRDGIISEDIIENYGSQIEREAEYYGLSDLKEQIHNYNHVKLIVGGRDFVTTRDIMKQYPESMFGRILSGKECAFDKRQDGSFYIGRDGTNFHHILEYLRFGTISDNVVDDCGESLFSDAIFYMLPGLRSQIIRNYKYLLIKVYSKEFVINRKVLSRYPESLFGKMLAGEDGDYVKMNDGSYYVERDGTNFDYIVAYLRSGSLGDDIIEAHGAFLLDDAQFYMLPCLREWIDNYHFVRMIIGGQEYVVSRRILNRFPNSMFGKMLRGERGKYVKGKCGSYVIEHNDTFFDFIFIYLRTGTLSDDIIEEHGALLLDDAEFYMLPYLRELITKYFNVKMIIGGREFVVSRKVLRKFPNSMFGKMLKGEEGDYVKRSDGSYVIYRDGTNFEHILAYLRTGNLADDITKKCRALLRDDADFYMLPCLRVRINKLHKVKMKIGGAKFVVKRKVLSKFPESLFGKMLKGEEGDYVKEYDGSYVIQRDATHFSHILTYLRSGHLSRFAIRMYGQLLFDDAEFYMLPGLREEINSYHKGERLLVAENS